LGSGFNGSMRFSDVGSQFSHLISVVFGLVVCFVLVNCCLVSGLYSLDCSCFTVDLCVCCYGNLVF